MQRRAILLMLGSGMGLAACGGGVRDSALNPGNWFGRSSVERQTARAERRAADADAEANANPLIPEERDSIFRRKSDEERYEGTPIEVVSALTVERASGGAIVRATGISLRQGAHDVRLKAQNEGEPVDGVLTFVMEAVQPTDTFQGPERSRTIQAARFVSDQTLESVRTIRVVGATNARTSARGRG